MSSNNPERLVVQDVADVAFVSLDESVLVSEAAKALYDREADTIIVTRNDPKLGVRIPIGIVTQRDLIYRVIAQNKGPFKVNLGSISSSPVTVVHREIPAIKALEIMKDKRFNRLPVVTKTGEIVGLVTMEMLVRKLPLKRLADASRH